jgi:hypothetical protein
MGIVRICLCIAFIMCCLLSSTAAAAPGSLDISFNAPNWYSLFNSAANNRDRGVEVAVQTDGKILVVGASVVNNKDDVLVLRLNSNGTLDGTFGSAGVTS